MVEQIRFFLKDDEEARSFMGANGFAEVLVQFLRLALNEGNEMAQGVGAMALFNLAVDNNRNKEMILAAGVIQLLEDMIFNSNAYESATALLLNLSCLDRAKPAIGSSRAVPFLVRLLRSDSETQCKLDALHTLYNLSTHRSNIPHLLSAGIVNGIQDLLTNATGPTMDHTWTEKSITLLINLVSSKSGRKEVVSAPGMVAILAAKLEGEPSEQEQTASCLLILCKWDDKCCRVVLKEDVIPALVSVSVNGTARGKEKALKLLMLLQDRHQRDRSHVEVVQQVENSSRASELVPTCKSTSNKPERTWNSAWKKSKSCQVYQC